MKNQYQPLASQGAARPMASEPHQEQHLPADGLTRTQQEAEQAARSAGTCFYCKHPVSAQADLCENCGTWLLTGQCCFCYTPAEPNQPFCAECGNPPTGILCGSCGTHSLFDYCPNCHKSLTEQAAETLEFISQSDEFQQVLAAHAEVQLLIEQGTGQAGIDAEQQKLAQRINDWHAFYAQTQQQRQQRPTRRNPAGGGGPGFDLTTAQANSQQLAAEQQQLDAQIAATTEAAREQLRKAEADHLSRIRAMQQKVFEDHQSARRYYESLKLLLPSLVPKTIQVQSKRITGWICNCYNVLHDGPSGCANPSQGGIWQYEIDIETQWL